MLIKLHAFLEYVHKVDENQYFFDGATIAQIAGQILIATYLYVMCFHGG